MIKEIYCLPVIKYEDNNSLDAYVYNPEWDTGYWPKYTTLAIFTRPR